MQLSRFLKSPKFIINLILSLLFVSGTLYGILKLLDYYTLHGQTITVPDLSGLKAGEIDNIMKDKQLNFEIVDSIYDSKKPKGVVVGQDPEPESLVKQNRTIYLTMNSFHPPRIQMPGLVDKSLRSGMIILENLGLKVGLMSFKPDICNKCILNQQINGIDIAEGELILKGSKIDLVLGMGIDASKKIHIPLLVGLQKDSAVIELQRHFLNLGGEIYDETVVSFEDSVNSRVYEQDPFYSENYYLPMGSSVNLRFTMDQSKIDTNLRSGYVSDPTNIIVAPDDSLDTP